MPTSATGTSATNPHPRARSPGQAATAHGGFTLIEILVVVVIIAVVTAGTVLAVSLTGRDRELEKERDRLLALLTYTQEQAELQTREYGVRFEPDGYEFLAYDTRQAAWRRVTEDEALSPRRLPDGLDLKLTVEGREVVLLPPKDAERPAPQVMIFSNGDLTSFRATLAREPGTRSVTLTEDESGHLVALPMVEHKP